MPDGKKNVVDLGQTEESLKIHSDILTRVIQWLLLFQQDKYSQVDPVVFAKLVVTSFSQYAAIVGVDVGMSQKQFLDVCKANFEEAYDRAPKFGD